MLFLSQPVGTGFSYQKIANGSIAPLSSTFLNSTQANVTGTYPILDPVNVGEIDTTDLAAMAAWHVLQGFLSGLKKLNGDVAGVKDFNLFTESYGGAWLNGREGYLNYVKSHTLTETPLPVPSSAFNILLYLRHLLTLLPMWI